MPLTNWNPTHGKPREFQWCYWLTIPFLDQPNPQECTVEIVPPVPHWVRSEGLRTLLHSENTMRDGITNLTLALLLFICGCMGMNMSTYSTRITSLEAKLQVMQTDLSTAAFEARQATKAIAEGTTNGTTQK
jgi:hypothetical protein